MLPPPTAEVAASHSDVPSTCGSGSGSGSGKGGKLSSSSTCTAMSTLPTGMLLLGGGSGCSRVIAVPWLAEASCLSECFESSGFRSISRCRDSRRTSSSNSSGTLRISDALEAYSRPSSTGCAGAWTNGGVFCPCGCRFRWLLLLGVLFLLLLLLRLRVGVVSSPSPCSETSELRSDRSAAVSAFEFSRGVSSCRIGKWRSPWVVTLSRTEPEPLAVLVSQAGIELAPAASRVLSM